MPPLYDADAHVTAVPEVHDVLLHATVSSSDVVPVGSYGLKFSPETVTETPTHTAMLDGKTLDRTGPSKVTARALVPTSSGLMVTANLDIGDKGPVGAAQETEVAVVHVVVAHTWLGSEAVAVLSNGAKLRPEIVNVVPEAADDIALTTLSCVGTGASKLNIAAEVPTKPETVTAPSIGSWLVHAAE